MISGIATAILLVAFIGGAVWVFSSKRKAEFDAAARIPLEDRADRSAAETEASP